MKDLLTIKQMLVNDELLYIETHNKETGWIGCASFHTNGEYKLHVNEGDPSGSDDASYNYEEFLSRYDYKLKREGSDDVYHIRNL